MKRRILCALLPLAAVVGAAPADARRHHQPRATVVSAHVVHAHWAGRPRLSVGARRCTVRIRARVDRRRAVAVVAHRGRARTYAVPVRVASGRHRLQLRLSRTARRCLRRSARLRVLAPVRPARHATERPAPAVDAPAPAPSAPEAPAPGPLPQAAPQQPAPTQPPAQPAPQPPAQPPAANPLAARPFYADPDSQAVHAAADLDAAGRSADAAAIRGMAAVPQAFWFGDFSGPDIAGAVDRVVGAADAAGRLPILVAYEIPGRDCGLYSAGGSDTADAYRAWIDGFARGIAGRPAAVVVEPDALANMDCLDAAGQRERLALVAYAARQLAATGAAVYLDAGHAGWQPVAVMADRLRAAGVAGVRGFSLNVSNFDATAPEAAYGQQLAAALGGGARFVVDTSRNGNGAAPGGAWCNPPGRAVGAASTADSGIAGADGLLWIKRPGESDGTCNGGPSAGAFWTDYALGLLGR